MSIPRKRSSADNCMTWVSVAISFRSSLIHHRILTTILSVSVGHSSSLFLKHRLACAEILLSIIIQAEDDAVLESVIRMDNNAHLVRSGLCMHIMVHVLSYVQERSPL